MVRLRLADRWDGENHMRKHIHAGKQMKHTPGDAVEVQWAWRGIAGEADLQPLLRIRDITIATQRQANQSRCKAGQRGGAARSRRWGQGEVEEEGQQ